MKTYFLAFFFAVLVVLTGLTLRRSFAAVATSSQAGTKLVAIGGDPVLVPPYVTAIGGDPVPMPPNAVPGSQAR